MTSAQNFEIILFCGGFVERDLNKVFIVRYFLAIAQTATALFFRRLCALLSFCILSIFISISSASAQFLSDGVTPVNPISDNATFRAAITACLNESAVTGRCQNYGDTSGYGDMENWDTSLVTDMGSPTNGEQILTATYRAGTPPL